MGEISFNRRVKVVIGVPEITTETYKDLYNIKSNVFSTTTIPTLFEVNEDLGMRISATTEPANVININNIEPNSTRAFYFKLESTRGAVSTGGSANEKTIVELANLNEETIGLLHLPNAKVLVYAGYQGGSLDLYYTGDIYDIKPSTSGDDKIYVITCKDGANDSQNTRTSLNYDEGMSVSDILSDMASKFPSASLGTMATKGLKAAYIVGGLSFQGNHLRSFEKLCKMYGYVAHRFNGKISIQPWQLVNGTEDYEELSKNTYTIPDKGIIALDPIIQNGGKYFDNTNIKRGVQLTTYLIPIELGQFFTILPESSKELAGTYKTTTVKVDINMPSGNFDVTIRGEPM